MKTNYVLIDYENVQPAALSVLNAEHFKIMLFVGATQTKIAVDVAAALQPMGSRVSYVQIAGAGPNALDFHIAYYIGLIAAKEPDAHFHIISKDTGFDPLIQHLKRMKVRVCRLQAVTDIPAIRASQASSRDERLAVVVANLQQRGTARPRTEKTLTGTIHAIFQKQLSDGEVAALVQALQHQRVVTITETKVSYHLPAA